MIRYLIKNNFKIMFRSPVNIIMFAICPIIISAVLISAFSSLLDSYKEADKFKIGYRIVSEDDGNIAEKNSDNSKGNNSSDFTESSSRDDLDKIAKNTLLNNIRVINEVLEKNDITANEYKEGNAKELMREYDLGGFVEYDKNGYKVYESEEMEVEGAKLEYILSSTFNSMISSEFDKVDVNIKEADHIPAINSTDYYGIVEIIYFGWCAIVCAAGLFAAEKKYKITDRQYVSSLSVWQMYLARFIPIITVVGICEIIAAVCSTLFLGVHFGNPILSVIIILLMVIAATAMEMMIYEITKSMIATVISSFSIVWIMGFFGGSFETYMFANHPESVKLISPIYHANRAVTELSSIGHSDYVISAILYALVITVVCTLVSVLSGSIRRSRV